MAFQITKLYSSLIIGVLPVPTSLLTVFKHNSIKRSRNNLSNTCCRGTADGRVFEEVQFETQDYRLK